MNIILSIHPKFVSEIRKGIKKFEYRKANFKFPIDYVFLYETSPVKLVTTAFKCNGIAHVNPKRAWRETSKFAGLPKRDFFDYYSNSKSATVIKIGKVYKLAKHLTITDYGFKRAPMSYYYTNNASQLKMDSLPQHF